MRKPSRSNFFINLTVVLLLFYLIFAVEQLRTIKCTGLLPRQPRGRDINLIIDEDKPPTAQKGLPPAAQQTKPVSAQQVVPLPTPTIRSRPPQPSCVTTGKRARSFLMVFSGHSGSTAIMSELRGHSQVFVEKFEPVDHQPVFNTTEALEIARDYFDRGLAKGKTPGFKIRPSHIKTAPERWRALAEEYDSRIIWQYRKNLFKASVGEYTNRYLNDTSVIEGFQKNVSAEERCKIGAGCSFRVDDMNFLNDILLSGVSSQRQITNAVRVVSRGKGCLRELTYEDYLYDREPAMADLQEFLGLDWEQTAPARFKVTKDKLCEIVENWDELCNHFYGCLEWQHQLDDPRNGCFCSLSDTEPKHCTKTQ